MGRTTGVTVGTARETRRKGLVPLGGTARGCTRIATLGPRRDTSKRMAHNLILYRVARLTFSG